MWQRAKAVTLMQSAVRGFIVRKRVLPVAEDERRRQEITEGHARLEASLRDLRHTCHGLAFLEGDRERAAAKIQVWWRSLLVDRVFLVLRMHRSIEEILEKMDRNAISIQSRYRGHVVRKLIEGLKVERAERVRQAEHAHSERTNRLATRIQAVVRAMMATREVSDRRKRTSSVMQGLPWDFDPDLAGSRPASRIFALQSLGISPRSGPTRGARRNSELPAMLVFGQPPASPTLPAQGARRGKRVSLPVVPQRSLPVYLSPKGGRG
mmetsp:Transcript_109586/g.341527  ORF Transcript_109586/g.341527 Transcript_109586/m.341527 type:complete len:266 (-) Transcript_109586:75-872(-)